MSTRAVPSNNSSRSSNSNNSSSNNNKHMSARRASGSRRISESSSSLGSASTSTSASVNQRQQQQHVAAEKSAAVKRKKRRKDEDDKDDALVVIGERVPVVLLTKLEREKKSKECKTSIKQLPRVTEIKVVIERTENIESIKALSASDKSVSASKKNTRHSIHRSNENLVSSDAKTLEPIKEEEKEEVVAEKSVKVPRKKSIERSQNSDQIDKSKCCKVKIDRDITLELNVNSVNNDNLKNTDPKIIERQLLVRLDRSEVENYLAKKHSLQRLRTKDKLPVEAEKYHSESETQDNDVLSKKEIETCAIRSDAGVANKTKIQSDLVDKPLVNKVTNKVERKKKEPVANEVKKNRRLGKSENVEETAKSVVKNQRLSLRERRRAKSQDVAAKDNDSDKDLRDDTKIQQDSSVQVNDKHLDASSKDTSCESAKSNKVLSQDSLSESSKSLNESAVVDSEQDSSKKDEINKKIIESNDNVVIAKVDSNVVDEPVSLPMDVDASPHDHTIVDDSKTEDDSVQQNCDIHSKNVIENAKSSLEAAETVDTSTKEILSESTEPLAESFVDSQSSESPTESLIISHDTECPAAENSEDNESTELSCVNFVASETSELSADENLVNGEAIGSPTDSFVSCENGDLTNDESMSSEVHESLIETIEDTESTTSTCTLIEEIPEELSQHFGKDLEAQEESLEDVDKPLEISQELDADMHQEIETDKELPQVAEKEIESPEAVVEEASSKIDKLDENFSQEDKLSENIEQESTFENNLKSVENLVIDSILNGEIVSPKIIEQSSASKVEEVQSFVFESGVEDFVNDIEVVKETPVNLEPSTSVEPNLEALPITEQASIVETPQLPAAASIEEPVHLESVAIPVSVEESLLTVEPTAVKENSTCVADVKESTTAENLEWSPVDEQAVEKDISNVSTLAEDELLDEEFAKHRRKQTLLELKKKCTKNIDARYAESLKSTCNNVDLEEPLSSNIFSKNHMAESDSQMASNVLSSDCYLEQTTVTNENHFENISDVGSDVCLAERLNQLPSSLEIPSLEDSSLANKSVYSDGEEDSPDQARRQRLLMKITKTDANEHVTHLVDPKGEEETPSNEQFAAQQMTEGEIKIIMRKESSKVVIKEIKITPRTPEGGNSARIPGYSPTSSDLSSGNSSCRVPSCSPAKPDSGSYRMPGWSPASTEIGQTTMKKKQGRPKKYPIFTDAELIAKTTAIVNNVDVHTNKLTEKPLFDPVESIRLNEDDEVEEEEHHTVISEQMCLSGDQLLDAMPAKPEVLAKLAEKIDEEQKKKKPMGRPRKYRLDDSAVHANTNTKVTENLNIARIEVSVVDSIEEFVESPAKSSVSENHSETSPTKRGRGRPRKNFSQDDSVLFEKSASGNCTSRRSSQCDEADYSMTEDETVDDVPVTQPYVERRGRKPWKHLKNINTSSTDKTVDATETNDAQVAKPYVERRGRKSWKHLKDINKSSTDQTTDATESNDAQVAKPYVERRGRKPWKHLKDINKSSADQTIAEVNATEQSDTPAVKPYVERRGRKPWKHLKNVSQLSQIEGTNSTTSDKCESLDVNKVSVDQVADEANSMNESEVTHANEPHIEKRGRKPYKNLNKDITPSENQVTENENSVTENESTSETPSPQAKKKVPKPKIKIVLREPLTEKRKRGRPRKVPVEPNEYDDAMSMTEDEADDDTSATEPTEVIVKKKRGRKPWKHLQNATSLMNNTVTEEVMTGDESADETIEQTEQSQAYVADDSQSTEDEITEGENSMFEKEATSDPSSIQPKKRGRKPWKHLVHELMEKKKRGRPRKESSQIGEIIQTQVVEEASSVAENQAVKDNLIAQEVSSITKDKTVNDAPAIEPLVKEKDDIASPQNVEAEGTNSITEDETVSSTEDIPTVDRRKRSVRFAQMPSIIRPKSQFGEESSSLTEDETVSSTEDIPRVEQPAVKNKGGRPRKISQTERVPSIGHVTMEPPVVVKRRGRPPKSSLLNNIAPLDTTEDETVSSTEDIPIIERSDVKKNKGGRPRKNVLVPSTEGENSSMYASSMEDLSTVVEKKKRGRKPREAIPDDSTCSESLAASSMEDLSTFQTPVVTKKPRGRPKIKQTKDDSTWSPSLDASSMEDLTAMAGEISPKKRGRPPKNLSQIKLTLPVADETSNLIVGDISADSIEEFSPVKQLSPMKMKKQHSAKSEDNVTPKLLEQVAATLYETTFDNQQPTYDKLETSLSPVKRRGRPPKYPRKEIYTPSDVTTDESQSDSISTPEQQPTFEKRKGRLPRRLSQDENILPSIIKNDVQSSEKRGRSPHRSSHGGDVITTSALVHTHQNEGEDVPVVPSLGKRQGRPPRKFSPDEEHSFSTLSHSPSLSRGQSENDLTSVHVKKLGRPRKPSRDENMLLSQSSISDSDEINSAKRRGRLPKKFTPDDEISPVKKRGRPPKSSQQNESLPLSQPPIIDEVENTNAKLSSNDIILSLPPPAIGNSEDLNAIAQRGRPPAKLSPDGTKISTLLRQQRKPKLAQQSQVSVVSSIPVVATPPVETNNLPTTPPETLPSDTSIKKRGRSKLSLDNSMQVDEQDIDLPGNMTLEQLRRRRHSQDDSMFTKDLPKEMKKRPKEFEDAQPKKKRGRPPKLRELTGHFVLKPLKPQTVNEAIDQAISPNNNLVLKEIKNSRMGRPRKVSPEKTPREEIIPKIPSAEERPSRLTAADYLRTWTDRDDSPSSHPINKKSQHLRRFSQDDMINLEAPSPSSRNRLRRYSQGDAIEQDSEHPSRKRMHSSGSENSIMQDEKRPRVEKELRTQHSITKELVVQLTKIDKPEEPPATEPLREIVRMSLRRKIESNSSGGPPPLVPIEPRLTMQPPTHSDAKLLMLMQPNEDKSLMQPGQPHMQTPPQQFCIIFIPDALTSSESSLNKDSQPTATIVNFQPVPDAELANKSVIYTPTAPTKIFVNEEPQNRSYLCATCTQALDLVGRLEANAGITEEDKSAIKCPFCSNDFQTLFYLEYHLRQEHLKCENEKQCRHSGFNTLRIPSQDASSESEIYITFALKCRSCYELFGDVLTLNEHVKVKHANLIRHKPPLAQFSTTSGMVCYPPPPFKNGARSEVFHCPSDCICRIGIRSTDSPMQRAQVLKRCPNFMRRLEKIEAAAYEVYTCTLCQSTFLMKNEVVEHLMKMHEVSCKFPCTKCLISFRAVNMQENHQCSETTIRDLDKLINIVILPTDKGHDNSKYEDSSNDELGPIKTTPPPAVPSASTPLNGMKRKNGIVIQKLTKFLAMQPPKKQKLNDPPGTPLTSRKKPKTPCPNCQKKFAYRKSLNDHIIFEHVIPSRNDEASKSMAIELLRLVNHGGADTARIEELSSALGKYGDDDSSSLQNLSMINDEQENWNDAQLDQNSHRDMDLLQCSKCRTNFKLSSVNLTRRNNLQSNDSPALQLCERCDPTRRRRNTVNNGHNLSSSTNGQQENQQQVRYTYECDSCNATFQTTIELNRHKKDKHSSNPTTTALKCDVCLKIFYAPRMLEKHKKIHHDESLLSNSRITDDENMERNNQSIGNVSKDSEANDTTNSSSSRRDSSDNNKEEEACKCPRCDFSAEKVSLKNHMKREHGVMAFICQFCGKLLVDVSEVRHMLDSHIKSSRKNGNIGTEKAQDDISELLKTLGKKRLQALMIYHDFEGKCNNAIMRCPICPEQFATRESCRHHYQWMHDSTCILCDANFSGGNVAGQHKVAEHNSIASYVWAIQRLVSAIVHSLRLDRAHPSNMLYQQVSMKLDILEQESNMITEAGELPVSRQNNGKAGSDETSVAEPFLEPVLSEDQLPGSGNMIEVVIGNDVVGDPEDNLLENYYLSPSYESSCEQPKMLDAGSLITDLEEEEEEVVSTITMPTACTTVAVPVTPSITTSNGGILIPTAPVTAETYATSAVFKLRQDNGQEEVVLAITDEDLVTYRDDVGSLAEKLSATCDSLSLEEITTMLRSYFENVGTPQIVEEVELANNAIEQRTQ